MMRQEYVVATTGDDRAAGTPEAPFRTLVRAQRAVRERIREGMDGDVVVTVKGGVYELEDTLAFDERDSGRDGFRVVYRGAPGERVVLTGASPVNGWEPHGDGGIWKAKLGKDGSRDVHALYADGQRVVKARLPASGYFETDADAPATREGIRYREGDLPADADWSQAEAFYWPGEGEWNWFSEQLSVADRSPEERLLKLSREATWEIGGRSRYYVQGSIDFLREPGQFHYDKAAGELYYWPPDGNRPADGSVSAPRLERLISLQGSDAEHPAEHIRLSGFVLRETNFYSEFLMMRENEEVPGQREGLIYANRARSIEIEDNEIGLSGTCGIYLDGYASDFAIRNNRIHDVGYCGIIASGFAPGEGPFASAEASDTNRGHAIIGNAIERGGQLVGHGSGILLYQSGGNEVSRNRIAGMPRYGVSLKGLRHKSMPETLYGVTVTWDNHWDFLHTRNNRIRYNDISRVMEDSQDGGLIESWGPGRGNVIHGNRLHHSGIRFSFGFGIYLDDASDDFTVTNNVLDHLYAAGTGRLWMLIFAKGIGNRIANNLLVDNPDAISAIGSQEMAGEANTGLVVERNVVCDSGMPYYFVNWDTGRYAVADCNLIWNRGLPCIVGGELPLTELPDGVLKQRTYAFEEWRTLDGGRYDAHTRLEPPSFVDRAAGDYRFVPGSAAYALGWTDIAFDRIGPESR